VCSACQKSKEKKKRGKTELREYTSNELDLTSWRVYTNNMGVLATRKRKKEKGKKRIFKCVPALACVIDYVCAYLCV